MILNENSTPKVLAVASGKGGVGKTLFASNLALRLAANGHSTIAVDMDLGGSNLHSYLGIKNTNVGIGNLLSDGRLKFADLIIETPYEHLGFVPGDVLVSGVSNLQLAQRKSIATAIAKVPAEYVIVDLGSGTGSRVVDFFLISNSGLIVTVPQAPAVLNAYSLLKSMTFRLLQQTFAENKKITTYLNRILKEKRPGAGISIHEIVTEIAAKETRSGKKAREVLSALQPKIIINMSRDSEDLRIIESLHELVAKNLEINLECLGLISFDARVSEAVASLGPFTEAHPESVVTRQIERIAQKILQSEKYPYMPLDLESYHDTYELARIEAEGDFEDIQQETQEVSNQAGIETAELIEMISEQKKQIRELRGALRMLTMKQQ